MIALALGMGPGACQMEPYPEETTVVAAPATQGDTAQQQQAYAQPVDGMTRAGPADECIEWNPASECIRWQPRSQGPANECIQWDPTNECIRWG